MNIAKYIYRYTMSFHYAPCKFLSLLTTLHLQYWHFHDSCISQSFSWIWQPPHWHAATSPPCSQVAPSCCRWQQHAVSIEFLIHCFSVSVHGHSVHYQMPIIQTPQNWYYFIIWAHAFFLCSSVACWARLSSRSPLLMVASSDCSLSSIFLIISLNESHYRNLCTSTLSSLISDHLLFYTSKMCGNKFFLFT